MRSIPTVLEADIFKVTFMQFSPVLDDGKLFFRYLKLQSIECMETKETSYKNMFLRLFYEFLMQLDPFY